MATQGVVRPTEAWMRNPTFYIRECAEVAHRDLVFMHAHLRKHKTDAVKWVSAHYGNIPWRILVVHNGLLNASAFEYDSEHGADIIAEWPIWEYGESLKSLRRLAKWADDNQGRIIIDGLPPLRSNVARGFVTELGRLQERCPLGILHLHGLYSYQYAFGSGVAAADVEPKANTQKGAIWLANGKIVLRWEDAIEYKYWIEQTGFRYEDLAVARNRTMSSIRAAEWAGVNFRRDVLFSVNGPSMERDDEGDPVVRQRGKVHFGWADKPKDGDYFACDDCQLQANCKFYRPRSLCAVPGSSGDELAEKIRTRDVDAALEVMTELSAITLERLQAARKREDDASKDLGVPVTDADVTSLTEKAFKQAETVAKMHDPTRFGTNNGRNSEQTLPLQGPPAVLASKILERLVAEGIPAATITPSMIELVVSAAEADREAVIGQLVRGTSAPAIGAP